MPQAERTGSETDTKTPKILGPTETVDVNSAARSTADSVNCVNRRLSQNDDSASDFAPDSAASPTADSTGGLVAVATHWHHLSDPVKSAIGAIVADALGNGEAITLTTIAAQWTKLPADVRAAVAAIVNDATAHTAHEPTPAAKFPRATFDFTKLLTQN